MFKILQDKMCKKGCLFKLNPELRPAGTRFRQDGIVHSVVNESVLAGLIQGDNLCLWMEIWEIYEDVVCGSFATNLAEKQEIDAEKM